MKSQMNALVKNISIIIFLFSTTVSAQEKIWLDQNLNKTDQLTSVYYKFSQEDPQKLLYFYKSSKMYRKISYSNNMLIANFSEFYETGSLKVSGKFENELEEGFWKIYYENGKIKERGRYKKGKKVGVWKTFYKNF
ncbi:MAG: hypothetical protein HN890_01605 [Polaribacter sp.]|nr:hypothetical protein [Polaribacter sp.]